MKKFDCYLFDFDGTLFDTKNSLFPVYLYGFKAIGMSCTKEETAKFMHMSLGQTAQLKNVPEGKYFEFVKAIGEGLDIDESLRLIDIFDETKEVLESLKQNNKTIGIVSGNSEIHMDIVLKQFNLNNCFNCSIGHESYKNPKPNSEPILVAMEKLSLKDKTKTVYIGDSLQDYEAAINAGINGILVDRENSHPDFKGYKIKNLKELIY